MDSGDLIFFGIVVISIVTSVVKAIKKKPQIEEGTGMPDFKGSKAGDILKRVLEEMKEKDDDYIPKNPTPVQPVHNNPVFTQKTENLFTSNGNISNNKTGCISVNKSRRILSKEQPVIKTEEIHDDLPDSVLQMLDLNQSDELKKAIIYSEILKPKF
jgi:hypothetical protein